MFSLLRLFADKYRSAYAEPGYLPSVILSIISLLVSLLFSSYAIIFSTERASNPVTDLILSNTRIYDVEGIYIYGALIFVAFIAVLLIVAPKRLPFTLYSLALFFVTRGFFVTLTHLGPFAPNVGSDYGATVQRMFFGDDYFFSGHTGSPFLMALIYWKERFLRYVFLFLSAFFGVVVLLGHLHYSIDVFAAFFITYSIYHIACYLFSGAKELFAEGDPITS